MAVIEEEERYAQVQSALGREGLSKLARSRVLVVGAGGIGCEVLKNLALTGFEKIVTVDLDTIDVSNLNRQFLFRREHVGMPKAVVARTAVLGFNPRCSVEAHHANIKESKFSASWFKEFAAVVNALDNVDARRHVNRMCLATGVPLIEAGTTGYLGQVFAVSKGETACYECFPKPTKTVYPICTIRATPDKPVHCVVWAKELFKLVFGAKPEDSMLFEDSTVEKHSAYAELAAKTRDDRSVMRALVTALFHDDVEKQLKAGKYDEASRKPSSVTVNSSGKAPKQEPGWDRRVWEPDECGAQMVFAAQHIPLGTEFDKDDDDTMLFVAAAANLRCLNFGIDRPSLYAAKGIAGNIIPAIATTNAIVAGLQVAQLVRILTKSPDESIADVTKYTYCLRDPMGRMGYLLQPTALDSPQSTCYVCRSAAVEVALDTHSVTLKAFVDDVLKSKLNFVEPALDVGESGIYDADDDRLNANLPLTLAKLPAGGLVDAVVCKATDYATDLELTIVIKHQVFPEDEEQYRIAGAARDELHTAKRGREEDDVAEADAKKAKLAD